MGPDKPPYELSDFPAFIRTYPDFDPRALALKLGKLIDNDKHVVCPKVGEHTEDNTNCTFVASRKHEGNNSGAATCHCRHSCNDRYGAHRLLAALLKDWGFKTAFQVAELHPDVCSDPVEGNDVGSIKRAIKTLPPSAESDGSAEAAIFDRVSAAGLNVGQIEVLKAAWIATKRGAAGMECRNGGGKAALSEKPARGEEAGCRCRRYARKLREHWGAPS